MTALRLTILKTHNSSIPAVGALRLWGSDPTLSIDIDATGGINTSAGHGSVFATGSMTSLCLDGDVFSGGLFASSNAMLDSVAEGAPSREGASPGSDGRAELQVPEDRFDSEPSIP